MDLEKILKKIRSRYKELDGWPDQTFFISRLKLLARIYDQPMDYPNVDETDVSFPEVVYIAYAVCHPKCGREEFIVDGSSQVCDACGGTMFRTVVKEYYLNRGVTKKTNKSLTTIKIKRKSSSAK